MLATLNIVTNPFHPTLDRVQKPIQRKVKINTLVNRHKINLDKPVVCYHNGVAVLRKQWSKIVVADKDVVSFVYLPQGGGGSNPLRLILMIGMMVFAPYLASVMGPMMGITGTMGLSMLSAGISFLGNQLINALIPPPQPPKAQQQAAMASPSPTYTIGAQGNQARIGQAIPVLYGTMKMFPDFAAQPYAEYENNEQYLYQLFCVSQGSVLLDPNGVMVEDSPISSFGADYQIEIVEPNTSSTLFPIDVYNVSEVSGAEMLDTTIGPFVANPATTTVKKLAFDVVLPRGLNYIQDDGTLASRSINFEFYAQLIDDAGTPLAARITLGAEVISAATSTPIRKTYNYNVTPGRYRVSALRTSFKNTDQRMSNDIAWASSRGYSAGTRDYGDVTLLAVKLKATNSISSQSSRKINIIPTRKLEIPVLNAGLDGYDWSPRTATQSIAYAIANMCRAAYGAGVTEARFDVAQLIALDAVWTARGDKLNCVFDSTQTFWEALCMACRAGRCRPYVQGGMIHFVRDAIQTLPTAMFTSRNIVKGSFKITYMMPSADNADCVDIEYFDEVIWKPRVVRAELDVGVKTKPVKVKAFGITNRAQAYKEGMYIAGNNRYRRKEISFETELEGHIPALGDLIGIQSDIPEWGQQGEAVAVTVLSPTASKITSSEPFTWTPGVTHYMLLRRATGSANGPIEVTQGANEYELVFATADIDFSVYTGFDKEKTYISFGRSGQVIQLARTLSTTPRGNTVQITAINEDARVHSADGTAIPVDLYEWSLTTPKIKPILADFIISQTGSGTTPSVSLSWAPAPGASRYIIETSSDNINWATLAEITGNSYSFLSNVGTLYVRIAAFGGVAGPYVTKSISVGLIPPPANVISGSISSNGQSYNVSWSEVVDSDGYYVEVLNAGSVKRSFNTTSTHFDYTLENGIADGGPWRAISVKVQAKKGAVKSLVALTLNGTNVAPAAPIVTLSAGVKNISVTVSNSNETDYSGTLIYSGDTAGFVPSVSNLIYEGTGNFYLHTTLSQKYYKAAHYDTYGKTGLNFSTEVTASPNVGFGVFIEYSANGTTAWHSTFGVGDLYMRQKVDSDGVWSDAIKIVGTDGVNGTNGTIGLSALTLNLSNDSHTIPTDSTGSNGVYTGSGTTVRLYEGSTELTYDAVGTANGTWKVVATPLNIVTGLLTDSGSFLTVGQHSAMNADTATISYLVTGKRANGTAISVTAVQSFSKAKAGVNGTIGIDGVPGADGLPGTDGTDGVAGPAGTAYWSTVNVPVLQRSDAGVYTPLTGLVSQYSATGVNPPALYAGRFVIDSTVDGTTYTNLYTSSANESTKSFTPPVGIKAMRVRSYLAGGITTLLDEVIIPVVENGTVGSDGADGAPGPTGDSVRLCYSKTTLTALSPTPVTISTAGNSSFPANASWGADTVWSETPPVLVAGESMYQSDGIYSAGANQTIWGRPYLSSIKVASLSAISANMGSLTSGTITLDNAGHIKGGQTAYATGSGFYLGYSGATYKFSIGNGAAGVMTSGLTWDGAILDIKGNLTAGSISLGAKFSAQADGTISIKSATTGARLEIANDVIKVFDAAGVLRVKLGNLA
jgi:hypothetical protein